MAMNVTVAFLSLYAGVVLIWWRFSVIHFGEDDSFGVCDVYEI